MQCNSNTTIFSIKCDNDDFSIEIEAITDNDVSDAIKDVEIQQASLEKKLTLLNEREEKLTNHADGLDYTVAVASGILCGLLDSFFVGKFDFDQARKIVGRDMQNEIVDLAKKKGWDGIQKGTRKGEFPLDKAIEFLEDNFKMPSDSLKDIFGGSRQHHLRDFSHHHSLIGLLFSVLTQFTGKAYGTDTNGMFIMVDVPKEMIGKDFTRKWAIAVTDWTLHLASDMNGSNATAGFGCGVPGPIVSLIKALSALPIFNKNNVKPGDNKLSLFAAKLYNGTLFASRDENGKLCPVKIDLRGERAIKHELGKQALPIVINEVLVRSYYLIRHLYIELKATQIKSWDDLIQLNWNNIKPWNNRTIARMLTIATGTFSATDLLDATIRSAVENGGNVYNPKLYADLVLRINFVGIGRFAIAVGTDIRMGINRSKTQKEIITDMNTWLAYQNCKICLRNTEMWQATMDATRDINELYEGIFKSIPRIQSLNTIYQSDMDSIGKMRGNINKYNPEIIEHLNRKPF